MKEGEGLPLDPKGAKRPCRHSQTPLQAPWVPKSWGPPPGTRICKQNRNWPRDQHGRREWTLLVEPPISHDKEALMSTILAPRILHLITQRLSALRIEVDARDDHRMGHRRLIGS
jgi:hypothetical protein